jgi:hypothetical protein
MTAKRRFELAWVACVLVVSVVLSAVLGVRMLRQKAARQQAEQAAMVRKATAATWFGDNPALWERMVVVEGWIEERSSTRAAEFPAAMQESFSLARDDEERDRLLAKWGALVFEVSAADPAFGGSRVAGELLTQMWHEAGSRAAGLTHCVIATDASGRVPEYRDRIVAADRVVRAAGASDQWDALMRAIGITK